MNLPHTAVKILNQLGRLVALIRDEDFSRPSAVLHGSTLGQHIRHTIEFFMCLEKGYCSGVVNYDTRQHDKLMESNRSLALAAIANTVQFVTTIQENRSLVLEASHDNESDEDCAIPTNVWRELVYNTEHAVHHMAMLKIGVKEMCPYITLDPDFGVAASTLRFRNRPMPTSLS